MKERKEIESKNTLGFLREWDTEKMLILGFKRGVISSEAKTAPSPLISSGTSSDAEASHTISSTASWSPSLISAINFKPWLEIDGASESEEKMVFLLPVAWIESWTWCLNGQVGVHRWRVPWKLLYYNF